MGLPKASEQKPKFKFEMRAFDGRMSETKQEALRKFQDLYGFKPLKAKTPGISPKSSVANEKQQAEINIANGESESNSSQGQEKQVKQEEAQQVLITEETSLLNSSYGDFKDLYIQMKKRQKESIRKEGQINA